MLRIDPQNEAVRILPQKRILFQRSPEVVVLEINESEKIYLYKLSLGLEFINVYETWQDAMHALKGVWSEESQ